MADELANDGVVGNGLIINRFNDTQHTFSLDATVYSAVSGWIRSNKG